MAATVEDRDVREAGFPLELSPAEELLHLGQSLYRLIGRRAYELYERRGRKQGQDLSDWLQAESEIVSPCRHALVESPGAVVFRVELPGTFRSHQIRVSVEPRRAIVSAEREVTIECSSPRGHVSKPDRQRLFHVQNLPVEVDPARSRATLGCERLEIVMPRTGDAPRLQPRPRKRNAPPQPLFAPSYMPSVAEGRRAVTPNLLGRKER